MGNDTRKAIDGLMSLLFTPFAYAIGVLVIFGVRPEWTKHGAIGRWTDAVAERREKNDLHREEERIRKLREPYTLEAQARLLSTSKLIRALEIRVEAMDNQLRREIGTQWNKENSHRASAIISALDNLFKNSETRELFNRHANSFWKKNFNSTNTTRIAYFFTVAADILPRDYLYDLKRVIYDHRRYDYSILSLITLNELGKKRLDKALEIISGRC